MGNKRIVWSKIWPPIAVLAGLLACWQAAVTGGVFDQWIVPSPVSIVQEAVKIWPRLMEHTAATVQLTLLGFVGGSAVGFVLAALLHLIPGVRTGVYPLLVLSQNIPIIVIGPILTMLLGYGLLPKVLLVMMVCFFPISVAMFSGLANPDAQLRNYFQMIGISKWQLFWRLELPHATVHLFSGLKIAASYSVLSAVVAEWLGTKKGLGSFMLISSKGFMPERVFAAVIIIIALSLTLFGLVNLAERLFIRWRPVKEAE
ncbi:ABC transporter permease [Paenibacillus prosopidis]|uniref:ABC-type nitrate/sulfonate/bicarbonate transport system permease component n=1 Tax=Paenibacillus prosopidis TaxID=630520 RepID=A0A368WAG1_9BACL|nr:ABC transporter permease [Paenibacillus prosopidis]RCW50063.1 ABC-type nitrate/sulfonate/bicarbonate transport system permease component [Paenibacillus prosopidis]